MKRILFIALLFVNLQIVMTEDGLSFTSMTASAQDMMYEMLDEIEVEGTKVQCSYCSKRYEPDEMDSHYAVCPCKPTSCPKCGQSVLGSELQSGTHHCYGSENTNDNGNNGVWVGGGSSGGGNGGGGIPPGGGSSGGGGRGNSFYDTEDKNKPSASNQYTFEDYISFATKVSAKIEYYIKELLKAEKIKTNAIDGNCHYMVDDKYISVPEQEGFTAGGLVHEIIHYIQDEQGMLNYHKCGSDNEYQAYVLNYIIMTATGEVNYTEPQGIQENETWHTFTETIMNTNYCGIKDNTIWMNECVVNELETLDHKELTSIFRSYYAQMPNATEVYYKNYDSNYQWNWRVLLQKIGITIKSE